MRALVVVESSFGNTRAVAEAVAEGLGDAEVRSVETAPDELAGIDLLVVGGPTHAFGMSRDGTRAEAIRQGAPGEPGRPGIREWLATLKPPEGLAVATFDTRVAKARHLPGRQPARRLGSCAGAGASRWPDRRASSSSTPAGRWSTASSRGHATGESAWPAALGRKRRRRSSS